MNMPSAAPWTMRVTAAEVKGAAYVEREPVFVFNTLTDAKLFSLDWRRAAVS